MNCIPLDTCLHSNNLAYDETNKRYTVPSSRLGWPQDCFTDEVGIYCPNTDGTLLYTLCGVQKGPGKSILSLTYACGYLSLRILID